MLYGRAARSNGCTAKSKSVAITKVEQNCLPVALLDLELAVDNGLSDFDRRVLIQAIVVGAFLAGYVFADLRTTAADLPFGLLVYGVFEIRSTAKSTASAA
ncbi:hypothetical protein [Erythrobacter rubeus]|uniref:Uncharacterized protein n=1 Tax=Erythrobacter rubeus TaxID=2760803 RepID=A0ABR8KTQ1_9SPHN|nr:hypothetical protein [Erythrobacter rubeus]MBD2842735.1 hypothetical protein [Erythrobacter rubeus]